MGSSVLSAGLALWWRLADDRAVSASVTRVFPVVAEEAELPYIAYRRIGLEQRPVKQGSWCDTVRVEVSVCSSGYEEGVRIAELVRSALDGWQWSAAGLHVRSCSLAESEESWNDDCYVQTLVFEMRI